MFCLDIRQEIYIYWNKVHFFCFCFDISRIAAQIPTILWEVKPKTSSFDLITEETIWRGKNKHLENAYRKLKLVLKSNIILPQSVSNWWIFQHFPTGIKRGILNEFNFERINCAPLNMLLIMCFHYVNVLEFKWPLNVCHSFLNILKEPFGICLHHITVSDILWWPYICLHLLVQEFFLACFIVPIHVVKPFLCFVASLHLCAHNSLRLQCICQGNKIT